MFILDPYLTFRLILTLLFSGLVLYDVIGFVVWYRELPRFAQRIIILKLLQVRSRALKFELFLIILLLSIEGVLMMLLYKVD
jgi:hypothetical protein